MTCQYVHAQENGLEHQLSNCVYNLSCFKDDPETYDKPKSELYTCFSDITSKDPSNKKAWKGRVESAELLSNHDESYKDKLNYSRANYNYIIDNKTLALNYINYYLDNNKNSSDAWLLKANIENELYVNDNRKYYSWAQYGNLTNPKGDDTRENITKYLSIIKNDKDAWRLGEDIFNQSSEHGDKAMASYCLAYYHYIDNSNKSLNFTNDALSIDRNYSETWILQGNILNNNDNTEGAIRAFINATICEKSFFDGDKSKAEAEAYENIGKIYQNESEEAIKVIYNAIITDELNSSLWKRQGDILSKIAGKNLYAQANYSYALAEFLNGNNNKAKDYLNNISV